MIGLAETATKVAIMLEASMSIHKNMPSTYELSCIALEAQGQVQSCNLASGSVYIHIVHIYICICIYIYELVATLAGHHGASSMRVPTTR